MSVWVRVFHLYGRGLHLRCFICLSHALGEQDGVDIADYEPERCFYEEVEQLCWSHRIKAVHTQLRAKFRPGTNYTRDCVTIYIIWSQLTRFLLDSLSRAHREAPRAIANAGNFSRTSTGYAERTRPGLALRPLGNAASLLLVTLTSITLVNPSSSL